MSKEIKVLQLGERDWRDIYRMPPNLKYDFFEKFNKEKSRFYDVVFIDKELDDEEVEALYDVTKAYALFVVDDLFMSKTMKLFFRNRMGKYFIIGLISKNHISPKNMGKIIIFNEKIFICM